MKYLIILALIAIGCSTSKTINGHEAITNLIPISPADTSYTNYFNVQPTTTPDGWQITYLVNNDTTRYTDAYIQWEKGGVKGLHAYPHVLEYRGQFMPQFLEENSTHIFMEHACATDCRAILALPKNNSNKAIDFENILGFDAKLGQVVTRTYFNNDEIVTDGELIVTATDLTKGITKSVTFKYKDYSIGNAMLDTVMFKGDRILINWEFYTEDKEFKETQVITF
jgi:hypothetical protein